MGLRSGVLLLLLLLLTLLLPLVVVLAMNTLRLTLLCAKFTNKDEKTPRKVVFDPS